uniref:Uncharacterized protein n=1 Tax=Rhizophora mucronata TaxID=61149 RepID=A0A2P2LG27_RHIMU
MLEQVDKGSLIFKYHARTNFRSQVIESTTVQLLIVQVISSSPTL